MRELVELIFGKKVTVLKDMVARNSSIPDCLLTKDFSMRMDNVMHVRKFVLSNKWLNFIEDNSRKILSSHETYLVYVMVACLYEHECYRNIFDSFISVCALVINFTVETLRLSGVDFTDLNPDIIMVFYQNVLKRAFHRRRDFLRFGEYIRGHKYLALKRSEIVLYDVRPVSVFTDPDLRKIILSDWVFQELPNDVQARIHVTGISLVQEVLANTSVELPTLPNEPDLISRLFSFRKRGIARIIEKGETDTDLTSETLNVTSYGHSSSNSNYVTNYVAKHEDDIAHYENIIEAVIRHNHSKNSGKENGDNKTYEVNRVLEHLKSTIKSLIEVLDKCDKE